MISVIQNFICTRPERLEYLKTDLPGIANLLKDYEFFVNYDSDINLNDVHSIYKDNVHKLNFFNSVGYNWANTTLALIEQTTTPLIMLICEDYKVTNPDRDYFKNVIAEFFNFEAGTYLLLHRHKKYSAAEYNHLFTELEYTKICNSSVFPATTFSSIAIYKRDFIIERLKEFIECPVVAERFSLKLPNAFEWYYHNAVNQFDVKCGIPTMEIVLHNEPKITGLDLKQR